MSVWSSSFGTYLHSVSLENVFMQFLHRTRRTNSTLGRDLIRIGLDSSSPHHPHTSSSSGMKFRLLIEYLYRFNFSGFQESRFQSYLGFIPTYITSITQKFRTLIVYKFRFWDLMRSQTSRALSVPIYQFMSWGFFAANTLSQPFRYALVDTFAGPLDFPGVPPNSSTS